MYRRGGDSRTILRCLDRRPLFGNPQSKSDKDIYISPICVTHAKAMEGWYCSCRAEEEYDGNKTTVRNMTESEELACILPRTSTIRAKFKSF